MGNNAEAHADPDPRRRFLSVTERHPVDPGRRHRGIEAVGRVAPQFVVEIDRLIADVHRAVNGALERTDTLDPRIRELRHALDGVRQARQVTQQFLAFSRSRLRTPEWLKLAGVLEALRPMLEQLAGESICLSIEPVSARLQVHAPPEGLARVLMTMVADAAEALPVGGTIAIGTSAAASEPGLFVLTVRPAGFGQQPLPEPADHDAIVASWDGALRLARDDRELLYELTLRTLDYAADVASGPPDAPLS
jgi:signal transduction histidine kinase